MRKDWTGYFRQYVLLMKIYGVRYKKVSYVSNGERKDCEISWYRVARW